MSELKPDSEKKEERLSDKEKVDTEKTNAEELLSLIHIFHSRKLNIKAIELFMQW